MRSPGPELVLGEMARPNGGSGRRRGFPVQALTLGVDFALPEQQMTDFAENLAVP